MNKYDPPANKEVCVFPKFSGITLKYECDCGKFKICPNGFHDNSKGKECSCGEKPGQSSEVCGVEG